MPVTALAVLRLTRGSATTHLTPLVKSPEVGHLHVLREEAFELASDQVTWHAAGGRGRWPPLGRLLRMGVRATRQEPIDVVVGFSLVPYGLLAWLISRLRRLPVVLCLLGTDFSIHCHAWYGHLLRGVLRRADAVTVTGRSVADEVVSWGVSEERVRVLPHSIDVDRFSADRPIGDRAYDLVCVGRLLDFKRVDLVIRVLKRIRETYPAVSLAIVGEGPERGNLERLARELGIGDAVTFFGFREDVESFYSDARVLVLASEREGLPLVLVEGMCSGCVPVSTRVGTIEDLIEHGQNGFLVDIGDWEAIAGRASQLLTDHGTLERMSRAALQARHNLEWSNAMGTWAQIFGAI